MSRYSNVPHKQGEGASIFQSPSTTAPSGWLDVVPPTAIPEIHQQISMLIICQRAIPAAASIPLSPHDGVFTFRILTH